VQVGPWILARTAVAAAVVGYIFGVTQSFSMGGIYGWIMLYVVGIIVGNGLHRLARYKVGKKVVAAVVGGLVAGALVSPMATHALAPNTPALKAASMTTMTPYPFKTKEDAVLAASRAQAQARWQEFEDAFSARTGDKFRARVPLVDGEKYESVWLEVKAIKATDLEGTIVNQPTQLTNHHKDESVTVPKTSVVDWLYDDGEERVGGFSMHAARAMQNVDPYAAYGGYAPSRSSMLISGLIQLAIFTLGVLSPIAGIMPPIRLPYSRY